MTVFIHFIEGILTKKKPALRLAWFFYTLCYETAAEDFTLHNSAIRIIFFFDWLDQVFTLHAQPHSNRGCHEY